MRGSRAHGRCSPRPPSEFDPTLPGLFAGDPPAEFVSLLEEIAADVRPESLRTQLFVMAEADQRDLLPRIAVPTLLIWGELDARSPLSVARQFEQAIPDTKLVVIPGCRSRQQPRAARAVQRGRPRVLPQSLAAFSPSRRSADFPVRAAARLLFHERKFGLTKESHARDGRRGSVSRPGRQAPASRWRCTSDPRRRPRARSSSQAVADAPEVTQRVRGDRAGHADRVGGRGRDRPARAAPPRQDRAPIGHRRAGLRGRRRRRKGPQRRPQPAVCRGRRREGRQVASAERRTPDSSATRPRRRRMSDSSWLWPAVLASRAAR